MASELLTHAIQPTANIVASASVLAASTLASKLLLNYVFLSDNTPVSVQQKDDKDIEIKPPPVTDNNPSGAKPNAAKPSVPVVKEQIVLPSGLDLTTYRTQDLKPDRSFIRAFYYIRFQKDPTDEVLESFVETDIIQRFLEYPINNMNRVFYVMHFAGMYEKAPYINFCKIRNAGLKSLDKNMKVTIEDLLKAAEASDTLIRYLKTTRDNIGVLSNFIKEKILVENAGFFARTTDKQLALIQQYGSNNSIVLELFNSLSTLISEKGLSNILEECLNDECQNLTVKNSEHMKNDTRYKDFIESLKSNNTIPEVNFPFRCGVGDMLANAKTKEQVCVTYIKAETKEHHNYGCHDRNSVDPTRYIIYEYKNHHCVLLIPKTLAPSSKVAEAESNPKPSNPVVPSSSNTSKTVPAEEVQNKNNNSPNVSVAPATEPCKKYEDAYFSQGGRKKKQKRVTKRRRRSKSRRKGTKRI